MAPQRAATSPALHFCVTRPNTVPGLADRFVADLQKGRRLRQRRIGARLRSAARCTASAGRLGSRDDHAGLMAAVLDAIHAVAPED